MKFFKLLGLTIGLTVVGVGLIFALWFCYEGHLFYFSKPTQIDYEFNYLIPSAPSEKFDELFKNSRLRGSVESTVARIGSGIFRVNFSYSSVYDNKSGKIYYKFRNYSEEAVYIKSETLRRLTGGLWKIPAYSTLYFIFPGPPTTKEEIGKLNLLYEEKILGINFKFSVFGTSMDLIVPKS